MPNWKAEIRRRLVKLKLEPTREAEIIDELAQHLEDRYAELLAGGARREEACRAVLVELTESQTLERELQRVDQALTREPIRPGDNGASNVLEGLWHDLRYSARTLVKNKSFTLVAVITLALAIGANTAIFTALNAIMLRALPVKDPQQLVILSDPDSQGWRKGWETGTRTLFSYPEFEWLRDHNQVFSGIFASNSNLLRLDVADANTQQAAEVSTARVGLVSGAYFSVLGVNAVQGRTFTEEVDQPRDASPVAVISYNYWKNHYAFDPSVLSRKVRIRQTTFDIIGVTPNGFSGETVGRSPEIWIPLSMQRSVFPGWGDWLSPPKVRSEGQVMCLQLMARLKPDASAAQAKAAVNLAFQQMLESEARELSASDRSEYFNQDIALVEGSRGASMLHESFGQPLLILMGLVGLVLLIASANVANLLLARGTMRRKEIALRVALGASRRRVVQQLLAESALLALIGGGLGLLLAQWGDVLLLRLVSSGSVPVPLDLHPDARILLFTLAVSLLAGILFGLAPAVRATRMDLNEVLKAGASGSISNTGPGGKLTTRKMLVIGQVAVSFVLLIAAGLMVRTFQKLMHLNPGYDHDQLLLVSIYPEPADYKGAALTQLDRELLERFNTLPGMNSATLSSRGLFNWGEVVMSVWLDGETMPTEGHSSATFDFVGPQYFSTLGIPILAGREIGREDEANAQRVGVINQTMAREYFGDADPLGRRLHASRDHPFEIIVVGVAADAKYNSLREQTPSQCYLPYFHSKSEAPHATFEIRLSGSAGAVASAIRAAAKEIAPSLRAPEIHAMSEIVEQSLTTERMLTQLSSFFGLLALLLACIGLYGVMSYNVASRTNEIGIRMALGAQAVSVFRLIAGQGMMLVLIGVVMGAGAAFVLTRLIREMLFGVSPTDLVTFAVVAVLLPGVALGACFVPARRATRVDPMVALRYE